MYALVAACWVGLLTGLGVSALNLLDEGLLAAADSARYMADGGGFGPAVALALPVLGGLGVSTLRAIAGGDFDARPSPSDAPAGKLAALARPWLRGGAAVLTLGTGSSLGPEGPSVDIGRDWARFLDDKAVFSPPAEGALQASATAEEAAAQDMRASSRRRALLAAGSAAGVAAGFNAAISGVFFALETALFTDREGAGTAAETGTLDWEAPRLVMILLAAVLGAVVSSNILGSDPAFNIPPYSLNSSLVDIPASWLLGLASGGTSLAFLNLERASVKAFDAIERGSNVSRDLLPAAGGLFCALLVLVRPEIAYRGFANFNLILGGFDAKGVAYGGTALFEIAALKVVATAVSRGAGLVGGILAPSLFVGAALGFGFGDLVQPLGLNLGQPALYSLVGMAAVLAGVCRVPLTAALLTFELTQDYSVLVPTLGAVGLSFFVVSAADSGRSTESPLSECLPSDPSATLNRATLAGLTVGEVMDAEPLLIEGNVSAPRAVGDLLDSAKTACFVLDEKDGRLTGMIPLRALERALAANAFNLTPDLDAQQLSGALGCALPQGELRVCARHSLCVAALDEAAMEAGVGGGSGLWEGPLDRCLRRIEAAVPHSILAVVDGDCRVVGALVVDDLGDALTRRALSKDLESLKL